MRKTILLLLLASTLTTWASTYNYLTIATTAAESSVALNAIKKITFSGNNLVVTTIDGEETILHASETILLPAYINNVRVQGTCKFLETYIP